MRHDQQHHLARSDAIGSGSVTQVSGAADSVLQHCERCLPAPAAVPAVAGIRSHVIACAGRHGVQSLPRARQGNHLRYRPKVDEFLQHKITLQSTSVPYPRGAILVIVPGNNSGSVQFAVARRQVARAPNEIPIAKFYEPILPIGQKFACGEGWNEQIQDRNHWRGQHWFYQEAVHRHSVRAGATRHRVRADRHQPAQPQDDRDDPLRGSSRRTSSPRA